MTDTIEQVGDVDPSKKTSEIVEGEPESPDKRAICWFNGKQYGTGASICSSGQRLWCDGGGVWRYQGTC
jgi:hypothetical protein